MKHLTINIDSETFVPKYEVTSQPVNGDYFTDGEFIGRYDTKKEALDAINDIELVEGRQYIINYKLPDLYYEPIIGEED